MTYKVSMLGATLSSPYELLKAVFPQWNGEPAFSDGGSVYVKFANAETPVNLGPIIIVEVVSDLNSPFV